MEGEREPFPLPLLSEQRSALLIWRGQSSSLSRIELGDREGGLLTEDGIGPEGGSCLTSSPAVISFTPGVVVVSSNSFGFCFFLILNLVLIPYLLGFLSRN